MDTETQIDSLVLDVSVKDSSQGKSSAQKLSALTRTLLRFESAVLKLDVKAFRNKFKAMALAVNPFVTSLKGAKSTILAIDRLLSKKSLTSLTKDVDKINQAQNENEKGVQGGKDPAAQSGKAEDLQSGNEKSIKSLSAQYGTLVKSIDNANGSATLYYEQERKGKTIISQVAVELDKNNRILEDTAELQKQTIRTNRSDIMANFKRVAMYRLVRTVLKEVTQSLREGLDNVARFDKESRSSMSTISSSLTIIKNSIGTAVMPFLKLATPLINGLARGIGTLANGISYLTAKLQGQSRYMKVNLDYLREYNKETKLLDFDNFSALNRDQENVQDMFEWEDMGEGASGLLKDVQGIEASVWGIVAGLTAMGIAKIAQWVAKGGLKDLFKDLGKVDDKMSSIKLAVVGIGLVVSSIFNIINWDETTTGLQKTLDIITLICGVVAVICGLLAAFLPTGAAKVVKATAAVATFIGLASGVGSMVSKHADGGMFEGTGTIYHQAGEAGAEVVATGTKGTGVLNVEQFQMAMLGALNDYGAARSGDMKVRGNVYMKEKVVGEVVEDSVYNTGVRVGHFK